MIRRSVVILTLTVLAGCFAKKETSPELKLGIWRATVEIQNRDLPFNFEVKKSSSNDISIYLINADEKILLDEVTISGDSVDIVLHVFDANIKARIKGDTLQGVFVKNPTKDYQLPFRAIHGQTYRFAKSTNQLEIPDFSGKYEVKFIHEKDTTPAIGIFKQQGDSVTGTFLTPTGDYRYLQGNVANGTLQLSTFDGNHAYLFTATKLLDGTLSGTYYSGKTWMESWVARKNEHAVLPDAEQLTYLKKGYDRISFTFPDVNGRPVSLADDKYKNKVVILQLSGTWCPNCMDETKFLAPWYLENKERGVEIIGLAYERKDDFAYASMRVKKMMEKFNVSYDYVIAGTDDKEKASDATDAQQGDGFSHHHFYWKGWESKRIHTGFSGPGTGVYYEQFIQHFNETVNELLAETETFN